MITTRPLTPSEQRQLDLAQMNALDQVPYFAHAIFRLTPVAAPGLGTFAVDPHWRLYLDPDSLTEWAPAEAGAVLAHEVSHLLREHHARAEALGAQIDRYAWNLATDAAINESLYAAGLPLPDGCITPQNQGLPANGIEEAYYAALRSTTPPDDGEPGCGTGAGDAARGYELPATDRTHPGLSPAQADISRRQVAQDVQAASASRGTVPAGLQRWADDTLAPPKVNWRKELRSQVRRAVTWARGGGADTTYTRPGRRVMPGILTPATQTPHVTVAVVVDTSGSMSPAQLQAALAELGSIAKHSRAGLTVATVDTHAHVQHNVRRAEEVTLTGGGGTDMRVGIRAVQAVRGARRPDVIVVLTDGFTPWPDTPTRQRLIVTLIGPHAQDVEAPAWAGVVRLSD